LGASVNVNASSEFINISANCLVRNYDAVRQIVEEILLEPRWDEAEFERVKQATLGAIAQRNANPNAIAGNVFYRKLYGDNHILSQAITGTEASVNSITLEDLKAYYKKAFSPSVASIHVAGDIQRSKVMASFENLAKTWKAAGVIIPEYKLPDNLPANRLFFIDIPDAKQSVIMAGGLAMERNHPDYFPASFVNYKLGEGSGSKLFGVLRLEKGYTYGAYSFFMPRRIAGPFVASSSVQSMYTLESVQLFNEILSGFGKEYTSEDLELTRNAMIRSNAGKFETINSLMGMLSEISTYNLPVDYVKQEEKTATAITLEEARTMYEKYINAGKMIYVVVGDARTQFDRLKQAGLGEPVLIDKEGNPVKL
jgi:zinc protease